MKKEQPQSPVKAKPAKLHKIRVSYKEREYFAENLGLLLKSSVPIGEALQSIGEATHSKAMIKALAQINSDVDAGYSLADAIERSGIMSDQTLALLRLGEHSGRLVENLQLAAAQEEKRHIFQANIRSALLYPTFVLSITLVVGLGVAWFLLPHLNETFSQLHVKLPLLSRVMIGIGVFLRDYGSMVVPVVALGLAIIGYVLFKAPKTKWMGRRLLFFVPGVGRLLREVEIAQFGYLLGTLLDAGLPVTEAFILLTDASSSRQYQRLYRYLRGSLDNGYSMREALLRNKKYARLLPSSVQQMVIAGERSGALSDVLKTVGRTYEAKADITTENLETIMEPILLLVVAGGVLIVAIAVLVPIYSLLGGLNR